MKGKRYTTEEKIRILREADRGQKSTADAKTATGQLSMWFGGLSIPNFKQVVLA
jgi:hypothetical protein